MQVVGKEARKSGADCEILRHGFCANKRQQTSPNNLGEAGKGQEGYRGSKVARTRQGTGLLTDGFLRLEHQKSACEAGGERQNNSQAGARCLEKRARVQEGGFQHAGEARPKA